VAKSRGRDRIETRLLREFCVFCVQTSWIRLQRDDGQPAPSPFGTVANAVLMMERHHRAAAACTTCAVCMAELARFASDLRRHVHLENNVLFPAAIRLESQRP
jgi:hypothetical protein